MDEEINSEVSLLDLLLAVVGNLKLLILGPLLVGMLVFGVTFVLPQKYVSQAIIALPPQAPQAVVAQQPGGIQQAAVMMTSPRVLDPVIDQLQLLADLPPDVARKELSRQIKVVVGKDNLLRLEVMMPTPAQAQAVANAIIDAWIKTTEPNEEDRAALQARLALAKESLALVRRFLKGLFTDSGAFHKPLARGEAGISLAAIGQLEAQYLNDVLYIPRALRGFARDDVIRQMPTLPVEPVAPKKGLIAVLGALAAVIVLFMWVFMRQVWRNAAQDSQTALKLVRLRSALGLGR